MNIPKKDVIDNIKEECVQACLTTRDFCGNERRAIIETAADYGVRLNDDTIFAIVQEADKRWKNS